MTKYSGLPAPLKKSIRKHEKQEDPTDLRGELAVARALLEQAQGNPSVSVALLQTITRLVREFELSQVRKREMLHVDTITKLASQMVSIISHHLRHVDGYETIIDSVCREITQAIDTAE